ncbi:MAG: mannonate dehydratase, partial [SAR202 cluster bacterium]|nr:mannonate dehydratase [SAR202 cluster bacterium]
MRPGFGQFNTASSEYLRFAAQYGVKDILLNNPILQEEKPGIWSKKELAKLKLSIESYNLQLSAIENVPTHFYDHIMLNGPNKNMQIENMIQNIENMADVGIPIFGYNWMPSHVWRTNPRHIRGGAIATAFDYESAKNYPLTHDREYSEDEMWESLEEWIK